MYVTPAGAGNKDGTDWDNAFGFSEYETDLEGSAEAGDVYYLAGGTYTLTQDVELKNDGSATAAIKIIGVKSGTTNEPPVYSDYAFGDDRPLFAAGGYDLYFDNYAWIENFRVTTTDNLGMKVDYYSWVINCKCYNSSATANVSGLNRGSLRHVTIFGDYQSDSGEAGELDQDIGFAAFVNWHDSNYGVFSSYGDSIIYIGCVFDTNTTAATDNASAWMVFLNNVFYNNGYGWYCDGTSFGSVFINNIFDANTTGASNNSAQPVDIWDYNCWDNTTDTSNVTKGPNAVTSDPSMVDPGSSDFTLDSGSACFDAGGQPNTNMGLTGDYEWNIGADQDDG